MVFNSTTTTGIFPGLTPDTLVSSLLESGCANVAATRMCFKALVLNVQDRMPNELISS